MSSNLSVQEISEKSFRLRSIRAIVKAFIKFLREKKLRYFSIQILGDIWTLHTSQIVVSLERSLTMSILEKFVCDGLVGDLIDEAPGSVLSVSYPGSGVAVGGVELTPTQVKDQPKVEFEAEAGSFYTLLLTGECALMMILWSTNRIHPCRSRCADQTRPEVSRSSPLARCQHSR